MKLLDMLSYKVYKDYGFKKMFVVSSLKSRENI